MRIHLGHHFYGAGNLGDDFMLAGFLTAIESLAPELSYTACVPFPLAPLRRRFPAIEWRDYSDANRARSIAECDAWLGLGGSPFQSAQSRWFIDHLLSDETLCHRRGKPMFFLGIGVQTADELTVPDVRELCGRATAIWTRDATSAERIAAAAPNVRVAASSDLAHVLFQSTRPPAPTSRRITVVANFDYGAWPGLNDCLRAIDRQRFADRVWLAQESRELPGAERALFTSLSDAEKRAWQLVSPEDPGAPLHEVLARWPSGECLLSARYHAAIAGAWAGSKVIVITTNEKLRSAATELTVQSIAPDATLSDVESAVMGAQPASPPTQLATRALTACGEFVAAVRAL